MEIKLRRKERSWRSCTRAPAGALLGLSTAACLAPEEPTHSVLLDGLFDEWTEAATLVDDAADAPGAAVDILAVQALDDPRWLYLALDVGNEVALQGLPGTLHLLLDVDGSGRTGASLEGMDGVDLVVDFSRSTSPLAGRRGVGFSVRAVGGDGAVRAIERHGLGLMAAPTWAAPRFEVRLSRLGTDDAPAFGNRMRLRALYREDGAIRDETEVGSYAFRTTPTPPGTPGVAPGAPTRLPQPPGSVRVAVWNVASGFFTLYPTGFARVLAAVEPDVVLLDELPLDVTDEWLEDFFDLPPLDALGTWSFALGETGRSQRVAVAATEEVGALRAAFTSVPYAEGSVEQLADAMPDPWQEYVAGEVGRGVPAAAAWIELRDGPVLFAAVDLQSGGWPDSPRDRLRTLQATTLRTRIARELAARPGPVMVGGDLNLVGSRAPLFSLVRGLDLDGSDLVPVDAERLGERTLATWRHATDVFAPGRLDFLLIPDATATVANSFVFATEDLDAPTLERLGLERETMRGLSDHLIVVADLRFGAQAAAAR